MHKIKNFLNSWFSKKSPDYLRFDKVEFVSSLADVPKNPDATIYIVQKEKYNKWVVFKCPDNCGNRVEVNLMKSRAPYWKLKIRRKKVTLYPSVVVESCGAHFWLIDNQVKWSSF